MSSNSSSKEWTAEWFTVLPRGNELNCHFSGFTRTHQLHTLLYLSIEGN